MILEASISFDVFSKKLLAFLENSNYGQLFFDDHIVVIKNGSTVNIKKLPERVVYMIPPSWANAQIISGQAGIQGTYMFQSEIPKNVLDLFGQKTEQIHTEDTAYVKPFYEEGYLLLEGARAELDQGKWVRNEPTDIIAQSWGVMITLVGSNFYLLYYPQGPDGHLEWALRISVPLALKIRRELNNVSMDRYAEWPIVAHILQEMKEVSRLRKLGLAVLLPPFDA